MPLLRLERRPATVDDKPESPSAALVAVTQPRTQRHAETPDDRLAALGLRASAIAAILCAPKRSISGKRMRPAAATIRDKNRSAGEGGRMTGKAVDRRPAVVVFDFGGVLLDWGPRHLYRRIFADPTEMEWLLGHEWFLGHGWFLGHE